MKQRSVKRQDDKGAAQRLDNARANWHPTRLQRLVIGGVILLFWAVVLIVGGLWLLKYRNEVVKHTEQLTAIEAQCDTKGGDYGLYHDDGNKELPVCREPVNDKEWQALQERRAYREGLRSGDVDADTGDSSGLNEYPH